MTRLLQPARRLLRTALLLPVLAVAAPAPASAQEAGDFVAAAGVGGTFYCIVTRCNTGATVGALVAYDVLPFVMLEAGAKRHFCFDCDSYVILDAGVQLRYPHATVQPFLGAGVSRHSDAEFMGTHTGPHAAAGVWVWARTDWGVQAELRGTRVRVGDYMGEISLSLARRFR
jgi:hypothetical protein